ncbi:cysteine--tRNA ligase [Patescibacteria group bacterium]|nr:cysteine--tRNA ligase [Patescibacteria group bacterium]
MFGIGEKKDKRAPVVLYNSLGREKQEFKPLSGRAVKMYTCGPTVYDYVHIGNLRSYIFPDVLRRLLKYSGYDVKQIINITDVGHLQSDADDGEDKMTAGLKREGLALNLESMKVLADRYTAAFVEDIKDLNIELPFAFPRASEHIPEQIAYIQALFDKGYAYTTSDGVYFDTAKFPNYGILGGTGASEDHARVALNKEKKHPQDFSLWKFNEKLGWDTPWGKGFPGWHIECTAMSTKYFGKTFDIHTGGIDHIAIHHNNEIAQAEAASGTQFVRYWLHGAFIHVGSKRIGKSEGNAIRLYQIKERGFNPLAYRYLILTGHYRSPMNFTWEALEAAQTALYRALRMFADLSGNGSISAPAREKFENALKDDLNTPEAVAVLWEVLKDESMSEGDKRETILLFDKVLGLGFTPSPHRHDVEKLSVLTENDIPEAVRALVAEREAARAGGEWARADELRAEIEKAGFSAYDTKEGTELRVKQVSPDSQ